MKLGAIRRNFIRLAGKDPRGWDDIWAAFVAIMREPVEAQGITRDNMWLEIAPPHPPYSLHLNAILTRRVGIRGRDPDYNLEAAFVVSAKWDNSVDVGPDIIERVGRGPSSYKHDPAPPVDEFVASVEQLPAVAELKSADAAFCGVKSVYQRPQELD